MSTSHPDAAQIRPARSRALPVIVPVAFLIGVAFFWTFRWMVIRWDQTNSYYSHGWLIFPASVFLLYLKRKRIASCTRRPCRWAILIVLPCLLLHLVATAWRVGFISGFALLGVIAGLVLLLHGKEMLRLTAFPIAFLVFMIPLPGVLIEKVSFDLKMMAAATSTWILDALGLAAIREGSYIYAPRGPVVVDDVCSGLKYLISLAAFGALYAYISALRGWLKGLLFALAIPISFAANVLRVTLLVLVAYTWGTDATQKWYSHDLLGFVLFAVAFVMLFVAESLLLGGRRSGRSAPEEPPGEREAVAVPAPSGGGVAGSSRLLYGAVLSALAVTALLSTYLSWPRPTTDVAARLAAFPLHLGPWRGSDVVLKDRVYEILGTRDVLSRVYRDDRQDSVQLVIVLAEQIRRRTHPPEQCVTGEGFSIIGSATRSEPIAVAGRDGPLEVHELLLTGSGGTRILWFLYKSGPHLSSSYWRHQVGVALRKFRDPNASDVLVRVSVRVPRNDLNAARQLLRDFLGRAMGPIMTYLP